MGAVAAVTSTPRERLILALQASCGVAATQLVTIIKTHGVATNAKLERM